MESPFTDPVAAMWCPSCPLSASGFSTISTFWSLLVTMTIFAPAARHFLVHASAPAFAPLAPHLSSATQPLTVALFPMSSNASADTASTKNNARQISRIFFMDGILLFVQAADPHRRL